MSNKDKLKLLAGMLAREKATPQKPASMGEVLDAERWRGKVNDPAAEAVLSDYVGSEGLERAGNESQMREAADAIWNPGGTQRADAQRAWRENMGARYHKAQGALDRERLVNPWTEDNTTLRNDAAANKLVGGEPYGIIGGVDSGAERSYWRSVEDPDILPASVGAPAGTTTPVGTEEGPGLGYLRRGAAAIDSLLPEDKLEPATGAVSQDMLDALATTPHGRLMGAQTLAEREEDKRKGIGPARRLLERLLRDFGDPMAQGGGGLIGRK